MSDHLVAGIIGLVVWTLMIAAVSVVITARWWMNHHDWEMNGLQSRHRDYIDELFAENKRNHRFRFEDGVRCGKKGSWTVVDMPDGTSMVCEVKATKEATKQ